MKEVLQRGSAHNGISFAQGLWRLAGVHTAAVMFVQLNRRWEREPATRLGKFGQTPIAISLNVARYSPTAILGALIT